MCTSGLSWYRDNRPNMEGVVLCQEARPSLNTFFQNDLLYLWNDLQQHQYLLSIIRKWWLRIVELYLACKQVSTELSYWIVRLQSLHLDLWPPPEPEVLSNSMFVDQVSLRKFLWYRIPSMYLIRLLWLERTQKTFESSFVRQKFEHLLWP